MRINAVFAVAGQDYGGKATTGYVYNHLHTVHAIACCNAAEVAMAQRSHGAAEPPLDPEGDGGALPGESDDVAVGAGRLDPPDFAQITEGVELTVPVSVADRAGTEVVHAADITTWVTPADRRTDHKS